MALLISDNVLIAIIGLIGTVITSLLTFVLVMLRGVAYKVDGILSKSHADEKTANTRADTAEAFTKGSDSERERGK